MCHTTPVKNAHAPFDTRCKCNTHIVPQVAHHSQKIKCLGKISSLAQTELVKEIFKKITMTSDVWRFDKSEKKILNLVSNHKILKKKLWVIFLFQIYYPNSALIKKK